MLTYQQFLEQGVKNSYQNGVKAVLGRPLARAFKKEASDSSDERMEHLKKMLAESKTGKQTLDFLEQKGSKIMFEEMDYYGYFSPDNNVVALNPAFSDEDLAVTFVHEVRHAWQDSQIETTTPEMTPKAFLMSGFMIEADACATEVLYAHEMREKNPAIWNAHQKSPYAPMSTQFEKTFKETGDVEQARGDALKTWYDITRIKASYSDQYVDFLSEVGKELKKQKEIEPEYFAEDRSAKKMVKTLLKDYDGKHFIKDAAVFESPAKLNITEKDANRLCRGLDPYMQKYKRTPEALGLDKIKVNKKDGSQTTCMAVLEEIRAKKAERVRKSMATKALHAAASR